MKRRGTKTRTATRKQKQKRTRRIRGGDNAENNARRAYFEGIRLRNEKKAFGEQLDHLKVEQAGVPKIGEVIKLFRLFNQSNELIKSKKMRDAMRKKLDDFDNEPNIALRQYIQQHQEYQQLRNLILQRIADYDARI